MKTLFTITLIVELIFALGFIAAPGLMFNTFGVTPSPFATSLIRVFGSALLGFVVLLWYGRSSSSADLQKAILRSLFTCRVRFAWVKLNRPRADNGVNRNAIGQ